MSLFIWGVIGPVGLIVYWIAVFIFIVMDNKEPEQSLAWLVLLFMLPGLGGILYFLLGRDWRAPMNSKWRQGEEFIQPAMKPIYDAVQAARRQARRAQTAGTIVPEVVSASRSRTTPRRCRSRRTSSIRTDRCSSRRCSRTCATPSASSTTSTSSGSRTS